MSQLTYLLDSDFHSKLAEQLISEASKVFILVDSNTLEHVWPKIATTPGLDTAEILEINPGEESKSLEICHHLWMALMESGADRNSLLINLGGGVVTDLGGFIASTFKRGIKFINIPSSLLAMVDASVGGKTGINLGHSKNQIGVFNEAEEVIIFPELLKTLPEEHLISGFAEMVKHGLIADNNYWKELTEIGEITAESIAPYIKKSIEIKQQIVTEDPKEKGLRKILNFGHTFGHAIESELWNIEKPTLHGNAVALGITLASEISRNRKMISDKDHEKILNEIKFNYSLVELKELQFENLWKEMQNDKKNENGKVNFTLLEKIGKAKYNCFCEKEELEHAFNNIKTK